MGDMAPLRRCEPFVMRRTQRLSRVFGVDAAADDPPHPPAAFVAEAEGEGAVEPTGGHVDKSAASRMAGMSDRCEDLCMPTVLIVDDHPSFRVTARALLEAEGFDVVGEAEDGETALEEAARLRPEVVLLDVQLPGIDGFEVAARLTSWNGASPAVVLTSSRDATEFSGLVERSGARGFVPKAELSAAALTALLK